MFAKARNQLLKSVVLHTHRPQTLVSLVHSKRLLLKSLTMVTIAYLAWPWRLLLARGTPRDARKWLEERTGGIIGQEGRVSIEMPTVTKRGDFVPITVRVASPMTVDDYVKAIHIAAQRNPDPGVGSFFFSPHTHRPQAALTNTEAVVTTRLRLVKTQVIEVAAVMSNGSVWVAQARTKIFTGAKGCG